MGSTWIELFERNRAAFYERIALLDSTERDEILANLILVLNAEWLRANHLDGVPVAVSPESCVEGADTLPHATEIPALARPPAQSIADLVPVAAMERETRPALRVIQGEGKTTPRRKRPRLLTRLIPEVG